MRHGEERRDVEAIIERRMEKGRKMELNKKKKKSDVVCM